MKIALAGSLNFSFQFQNLTHQLYSLGYDVEIPPTAQDVQNGNLSLDRIEEEKRKGIFSQRAIQDDAVNLL